MIENEYTTEDYRKHDESKWEYRVIRFLNDEIETFAIREVFYSENEPDLCTIVSEFPTSSEGLEGLDGLEVLRNQVQSYSKALELPILDYTLFTATQPTESQQ